MTAPRKSRSKITPCPVCHGRAHSVLTGEGYLPPGYVLGVRCRACRARGAILVSVPHAERLYARHPRPDAWHAGEIIPRR
jgi:hypothetical protein